MKPLNKVRKAVSCLAVISFVVSSLTFPVPAAGADEPQISIPSKWGTVEKTFQGNSHFPLIYIQDAHNSFEAQENIAHIVFHLVKTYNIQTVYTEGYEGDIPLDALYPFEDREIKEKVSRYFMDYLRLSGVQYAYVNRTQDFRLIGIDDLKMYLANLKAYEKAAKNREIIAEDLKAITQELNALGSRIYPREIKEWLKLKNRLGAKQISLADYLFRTMRFLKKGETLDPAAFPHLRLIAENLHKSKISKAEEEAVNRQISQIDSVLFFEELKNFEEAFTERFLTDSAAKEVLRYQRAFNLLARLNFLSITPEEYLEIKVSQSELKTKPLAEFLARHLKKSLVMKKEWEGLLESAIRFYELAQERDKIFQKRIKVDAPSILVTGGFHRDAILKDLEERKISYLVISPRITEDDALHQKRYDFLMSGKFYDHEKPFLSVFPLRSAAQQRTQPLLARQGVDVVGQNIIVAQRLFPGKKVVSEKTLAAASLGVLRNAMVEAYSDQGAFLEFMEQIWIPRLLSEHPRIAPLYAEYLTSFHGGNKTEIKRLEDEIAKEIDQFNAVVAERLGFGKELKGVYHPHYFEPAPVRDIRREYPEEEIRAIQDLILEGKFAPEMIVGGVASRLGLGSMFMMDTASLAKAFENDRSKFQMMKELTAEQREAFLKALPGLREKVAAILKSYPHYPQYATLPLGARLILQYRAMITQIVRERYGGESKTALKARIQTALSKQKIVLLLNDDIMNQVVGVLHQNKFFGFDRKNVYLIGQPVCNGWQIKKNRAVYAEEVTEGIVNGHGFASMQKFFPGKAFHVTEEGKIGNPLRRRPLIQLLRSKRKQVRLLRIYRINDLSNYEGHQDPVKGNALDIPTIIESVKVLGGSGDISEAIANLDNPDVGVDQTIELVDNPGRQKGGNLLTVSPAGQKGKPFLLETIAMQTDEAKAAFRRMEAELGGGLPYNVMKQTYHVARLARQSPPPLPIYFRFREIEPGKPKLLTAETVTGDTTLQFTNEGIKMSGRVLRDTKNATKIGDILDHLEEQNKLFQELDITPETFSGASLGSEKTLADRSAAIESQDFARVSQELARLKNQPLLVIFSQAEWNAFGPSVQGEIITHFLEERIKVLMTDASDPMSVPLMFRQKSDLFLTISGQLQAGQIRLVREFTQDEKIIHLSQLLESPDEILKRLNPDQAAKLLCVKQIQGEQGVLSAALLFATGNLRYRDAFQKDDAGFWVPTAIGKVLGELMKEYLGQRVMAIAA